MKGKTIVFVVPDLKGNGAERVVATLAAEFELRGAKTHIVVFSRFTEIMSMASAQLHEFPMRFFRWIPRSIRGLCVAPLLDRFILRKCGKPDLVLSNLLPVDRVMCRSRLPNVYLVIHTVVSKDLLDPLKPNARMKQLRLLDAIYCRKPAVCISEGVMTDFSKLFPSNQDVRKIYNPVDFRLIRPLALEEIPNLPPYIINVGKFNRAKSQHVLLRAYARSGLDLPLVLVGQGPRKTDLERLVVDLGIEDKVVFAGFQKNPYPWIANATLMAHSAEYEGLGMVLLEAQALGVPVISTDCDSGPREILPANNLVPVDDVDALAEKMSVVAQNPKEYVCPLQKRFSPDKVVAQYVELTQ